MKDRYLDCIKAFKNGDNEIFESILNPIKPCILKYSYMLGYPEAYTDLIISLLHLLKKLDLSRFDNDISIQSYLKSSIRTNSNNFSKKKAIEKDHYSFDSNILDIALNEGYCSSQIDSDLCFDNLISSLKPKQQKIMELKYKYNLSDAEIGVMFKISRQAVHKQKTKALKILKEELSPSPKGGVESWIAS